MARRLIEVESSRRRRELVGMFFVIAVSSGGLLAIYILLPFKAPHHLSEAIRIVIAVVLFAGITLWQLRRIGRAEFPMLRAAEALTVIATFFLLGFASAYLTMAHASSSTFSQSLDHVRALYFTITVFTTVGFGDITPRTDTARIVVSVQMLTGLVLVGVVVRLIVSTARSRVSEQHPEVPTQP